MVKEETKSQYFTSGVSKVFSLFRKGKRFLFILLILMASCGNDFLIPKKDFISILSDIYLSKAYFSSEGIHNARWLDTIPYNHHIVERHGYEWAQFDSTVSWYCSRPKKYQEVYETVMANLNELDKKVSEELDPPMELWAGKNAFHMPSDNKEDSIPASVLLKGVGTYVLSAKVRVYPHDEALNPRIELYLWRSDTTAHGISDTLWIAPLRKDGLLYEYRMEKTLQPGNAFTHLRGNWMQYDGNKMDTVWRRRAEIEDISVYHIPKRF